MLPQAASAVAISISKRTEGIRRLMGIPGVVTVATIHAGTADNIMPDRALLTGTVRAVDPASRALLLDELRHMSERVAEAHHLSARVTFDQGTPMLAPFPMIPRSSAIARRVAHA